MSDLQERNRTAWSQGDWDQIADLLGEVGASLLDAVGVEPGMRVLDVGTGSGGNVAIPAARREAEVVGLDLTDEWFGAARRRAEDAGVDVEWVVGDAQDLPFEDESFDRVVSTFGHMFAPDHRRAGQELLRVCRPGGVVGFTTWLPQGYPGRMFRLMGEYMPPPPPGVQPPPLWGDRDHVREQIAPHQPEFSEGVVRYRFDSPEDMLEFFNENFPMAVAVKGMLSPEQQEELDRRELEMLREFNEADDGTLSLPLAYLMTIVRR